jgi:hypothetical protein
MNDVISEVCQKIQFGIQVTYKRSQVNASKQHSRPERTNGATSEVERYVLYLKDQRKQK